MSGCTAVNHTNVLEIAQGDSRNIYIYNYTELGIEHLRTFLVRKYLNFLGVQVDAYLVILGAQVVKWMQNWVHK